MNNTINKVDYTRSLPAPLKNDKDMLAVAKTVALEMSTVTDDYQLTLIYARIDHLQEAVIDILAFDFHIDWYDYRLPLEIKRLVLKDSILIHKKLGTRYSVERVLKAIYANVSILEWFEQEPKGRPYTFKLFLDASENGISREVQEEILKKLNTFKNLRSHLESIGVLVQQDGEMYIGAYGEQRIRLQVSSLFTPPIQDGEMYIGAYGEQRIKLQVSSLFTPPIQDGEIHMGAYGEQRLILAVSSPKVLPEQGGFIHTLGFMHHKIVIEVRSKE